MMIMKNVCIWKVDKSLEEIINLLDRDYTECVKILASEKIPSDDKSLLHKWTVLNNSITSGRKIKIEYSSYDIISCRAEIECNKIEKSLWIHDGIVLSKDLRVKKSNSDVMFLSIKNCTYCIVAGQKSNEGKIRSKLMESRSKSKSSWGIINYKDILGYKFEKEFYYWLIINKGKIFKNQNKSIKLVNVRGFKSSTERQETNYSGEGDDIDREIPLMSLISMDQKLVSLYIGIRYNDRMSYSFSIDYDGRITVYESECGEFATQTPKTLPITNIIMNIYFDILPFLLENFQRDKYSNWNSIQEKYKKNYAVGIIAELVKQNNLSLQEIEVALDKSIDNKASDSIEDNILCKENEEVYAYTANKNIKI